MEAGPPAATGYVPVQLTPRDRELLAFTAEHRFVLADHVAVLLGVGADAADARLRSLARAGFLIRRKLFTEQPALHRITRLGAAAIGTDLTPPRLDLHCYEHDIGVAWLWLAARDGAFGAVRTVIGERRLRSQDASRDAGEPPLAVRLGGVGVGGRERLHYPDLLLVNQAGKRLALELELTGKSRVRRERILGGYAADARVDAVVYLVTDRRLGHAIAATARKFGISSRVYVKLVALAAAAPEAGPGLERGGAARAAPLEPGAACAARASAAGLER